MEYEWGRSSSAGRWLSPRPAGTFAAILLGVMSGIAIGQYRYAQWTPLQRFYLAPYVRSTLLSQLGFTTPGRYVLFAVIDDRGQRFAVDGDVAPVWSSSDRFGVRGPATTFGLTAQAVQAGVRRLVVQAGRYDHAQLQAF